MRDWKEAIRTRLAAAQLDPTLEAEVIEELAHLEDRYQELQAGGVPGQECCSRLQEELEGCDLVARAVRHARRPPRSGLALAAPAGKGRTGVSRISSWPSATSEPNHRSR